MKKVGIVTLNGEFNYGNRLQAYALQRAVRELGAKPETIVTASSSANLKKRVKRIISRLPMLHLRMAYWRMLAEKEKIFTPFSKQHINTRRALGDVSGIVDDYDIFITGSDQVWNPDRVGTSDINLLGFAPAEKRASYAASFGVAEIPGEYRQNYAKSLKNFNKISVREEDGKRIVEDLTGRKDITAVPDPTMLLTRDDWDSLAGDARPSDAPNGKFIVIYALHNLTPDNQDGVRSFAKKNDYEIYQIMGDLYDKTHRIPDPRNFVWLITNAEAVFTDSFHCCVFSIIYHTPFIVFDRTDGQKMSSRLTTLTQKFNLIQAMTDGKSDLGAILASEDFGDTDTALSDYRAVGMKFLKDVLSDQ